MRRVIFSFPVHCRALVSARSCATKASTNPKLDDLANAYSQLTLKELSELQRLIFKKLGHSDEFYEKALLRGLGGGGGGVMMAAPAAVAAAPVAAGGAEEPPKAEKKKVEKSTYDVKLAKFTPDIKVKLIKELRSVTNLSISDAKGAIEKCPGLVQTNMRKEDAEKLKGLFEKLGATVELL
ncbi:Ribosomal protein L7/L12 [Trypanosoma melophagium]|uniref:Ribosomal protein L7/L12 n=1 Tax=Trypanosoma melophagium TaxID=715481 RepID=UPI00351A10C5|nr:Ribosomal protein L7/L12 [Trypanosoma melophagium]